MTNFLDVLKKDLTVVTSRIEVWETKFEEDPNANKKVPESDEECIVDEEHVMAPVECFENSRASEKFGARNRNIAHRRDTQGARRNERKRPEIQVLNTKDTLCPVKEMATLAQRIEILNWYHANGRNQTRTANHFDIIYPQLQIKQPLVSSWVNDESKWQKDWENSHGSGRNAKRTRRIPLKSLSSSSPSLSISVSSALNGPTDPIVKAEQQHVDVKLDATSARQTVNPMNTDVLSILPEESSTTDSEAPDNEASHSVINSQEVHEHSTEDVGSNNVSVDTPRDSIRRPRPTPKEALQAALVLKRYLAAMDDPFARNMEANLVLFIDQIRLIEARRNLKPTLLTDYFPRK